MIVPHDDNFIYPSDNAVIWNKHTVKSENFVSFLQEKEMLQEDSQLRAKRSIDSGETLYFNYTFVTLHDLLYLQDLGNWPNKNLQTVGYMKHDKDGYKLYPLSQKSDTCVKLKFSAPINKTACSDMYARVYGFCIFYASEEKVIPVHPEDLNGEKPYIEIRVTNWVDVGSLQHARSVQQILYKVNYLKNQPSNVV